MNLLELLHYTIILYIICPLQFAAASFSLYVMINPEGNILDTKKAFVSLNLINIISEPMSVFQAVVSMIMQVSVSVKRLNEFFRRYLHFFL